MRDTAFVGSGGEIAQPDDVGWTRWEVQTVPCENGA